MEYALIAVIAGLSLYYILKALGQSAKDGTCVSGCKSCSMKNSCPADKMDARLKETNKNDI